MQRINFANTSWMLLVHAGACAAPFYFTWDAFVLFLGLTLVTGLGITLGYHRLLTHRSFQTFPIVRRILAVLGALAGEGPPSVWVATHRQHHLYSDRQGDPHSPVLGGFSFAQWLWMVPRVDEDALVAEYADDIESDPFLQRLRPLYIPLHLAFGVALLLVGGTPWLLWGVFARIAFVLEATWLVNSASHLWGYRNYKTRDNSRNNWFVAVLAYGEGNHNNHHATPRAANHGQLWFEPDLTWRLLQLLMICKLAWNALYAQPSEDGPPLLTLQAIRKDKMKLIESCDLTDGDG